MAGAAFIISPPFTHPLGVDLGIYSQLDSSTGGMSDDESNRPKNSWNGGSCTRVQAMEQSVQGWEGGSREEVSVCERGGRAKVD